MTHREIRATNADYWRRKVATLKEQARVSRHRAVDADHAGNTSLWHRETLAAGRYEQKLAIAKSVLARLDPTTEADPDNQEPLPF